LRDKALAKSLFFVLDQGQLLISLYLGLNLKKLLLFLGKHTLCLGVLDTNLNVFGLQ